MAKDILKLIHLNCLAQFSHGPVKWSGRASLHKCPVTRSDASLMQFKLDFPDCYFQIFRRPEAVVFLLVVLYLGTMWGFLESFLFVFLKELNAPTYMLGTMFQNTGRVYEWIRIIR